MNDKKIKFEQEYPYSREDIPKILYQMLEFNPYFRKPASQLLKDDLFKNYRADFPKLGNDAPEKISLVYDQKDAFDYGESELKNQTIDDLKKILLAEIKII